MAKRAIPQGFAIGDIPKTRGSEEQRRYYNGFAEANKRVAGTASWNNFNVPTVRTEIQRTIWQDFRI
jgi:hypothetical protein